MSRPFVKMCSLPPTPFSSSFSFTSSTAISLSHQPLRHHSPSSSFLFFSFFSLFYHERTNDKHSQVTLLGLKVKALFFFSCLFFTHRIIFLIFKHFFTQHWVKPLFFSSPSHLVFSQTLPPPSPPLHSSPLLLLPVLFLTLSLLFALLSYTSIVVVLFLSLLAHLLCGLLSF